MNTSYQDRQRAIELNRKMKVADLRCAASLGPNVEAHGEWAHYDKTPRGGTAWKPGVLDKLELTIISRKALGQRMGIDQLAFVAREMGRSSDAVFQAMRKYRRDLLKHFCLEA